MDFKSLLTKHSGKKDMPSDGRPTGRGAARQSGEVPRVGPDDKGFRFREASVGSQDAAPVSVRQSRSGRKHAAALYRSLPPQLQEHSKAQEHLWEYLGKLPVNEIGVPEYYPSLSRDLRELTNRNLIYPLGKGVFVHIYKTETDVRDFYMPVEPVMDEAIPKLMQEVDKQLVNYVSDLEVATDIEERVQLLLQCLEEICQVKNGRQRRGAIQVSERELRGLKYLMVRDKAGMGAIEPLINDPYIEDVSCSGVGPLFIEHRIFGGLICGITFDNNEELDHYIISLSEKIGRPVTVREPIVDATLPDGSRVNIVYGGDVSKRGSNFTIRKFAATPMSILDLVAGGTLSYDMAAYISLMLSEGMNTFVSGETASGKTTMLNAISTFIPPQSKIVSIEDTPELQVPHPNWTREVVRGSGTSGSSVTMFDLLRAALRQRPNEIIIGEIRGEEGAIAFQAMQTGHACMATFHASSVEKLIQRLTGHPINIPKTYIDNLNIVIIMSAVRLADGTPVRRILSINEVIEYDPETNSFGFIEVFRWDPATDTFEFPGFLNTNLLENVVSVRRGIPPRESRRIYAQLQERADVLRKLHERDITNFYELHNVLAQANREGLFR